MDTNLDSLELKIQKARLGLSEETRTAIDAINWRMIILKMREEKGYTFTQLEDLEIETELLLCGLIQPDDYPKELEKRMGIPKEKVAELVKEMNEKVFERIREELIKNTENKENQKLLKKKDNLDSLESREEILRHIENPPIEKSTPVDLTKQRELPAPEEELEISSPKDIQPTKKEEVPSILSQKLSGSFQIPKTETEHTLGNMTKNSTEAKKGLPKVDPYREIPE